MDFTVFVAAFTCCCKWVTKWCTTDIYGDRKKVKKSKSYIVHGKTNLVGLQDKVQYARYKRVFQHGFSDTANREHEPQLIHGIATFIEKLAENELPEESTNRWTRPKNMALWCMLLR